MSRSKPRSSLKRRYGEVGGEVRRPAVGADDHAVLVVPPLRRREPLGAVLLVQRQLGQHGLEVGLDVALAHPALDVDAEALERRAELLEHELHRVALGRGELDEVLALVAVLGRLLPPGARVDGRAEADDLLADVVHVELARDLVAREVEKPRDRVPVGSVSRRRDRKRARRVRGDELDLDLLGRLGRAAAVVAAVSEDLAQSLAEPVGLQRQVQEPGRRGGCARNAGKRLGLRRPARRRDPSASSRARAPVGARRSSRSRRAPRRAGARA